MDEGTREVGIVSGYRRLGCTPAQCLASFFCRNVETANLWTHLAPAVYFLWRLVQLTDSQPHWSRDAYTWPLHFYMMTCVMYPSMSCAAHALSALSSTARHICFFADYTAISMYSFGCALLYRGYVLPDRLMSSPLAGPFLQVAVVNSLACTTAACASRFVGDARWQKVLRLGSFTVPYLWDTIPLLFYRLLPCWMADSDENSALSSSSSSSSSSCGPAEYLHTGQLIAAFLASFFYATHLPERLYPGKSTDCPRGITELTGFREIKPLKMSTEI